MHCWIWNLIGYLVHQSTGDWHVWGSGVRRKKREWVSTRSLFGCFRLYGGHISSDLHKWTVNQMATFSNVQGLLHLMWNEILVTDFFFFAILSPFNHRILCFGLNMVQCFGGSVEGSAFSRLFWAENHSFFSKVLHRLSDKHLWLLQGHPVNQTETGPATVPTNLTWGWSFWGPPVEEELPWHRLC